MAEANDDEQSCSPQRVDLFLSRGGFRAALGALDSYITWKLRKGRYEAFAAC